MNLADKRILVMGATGKQGGATARKLLDYGFKVRAFTRRPGGQEAGYLGKLGCEVAQGDMNDIDSLKLAMRDVHGVFSVQNFWEAGFDAEVRQGRNVADAAKDSGISHFVYSSVGSAHRKTGIPHFDSKARIEQHIHASGLPYTILRPVFFMENWHLFNREMILGGALASPLGPDRGLQQIAVWDVGRFAAMAFAHPEQWIGRELDIAGEELTMPQVCGVFSRVLNRAVQYVQMPWDQFRKAAGEESYSMYRWFNDVGYDADIPALRREYPWLHTLEQVVRDQDWQIHFRKAG